ncbi:MAG: hypothetical protein K2Z81_06080, partial [Cyanobacteria bacterium]|nr:hypothetical protein [Cyanobacteriota bacterium]
MLESSRAMYVAHAEDATNVVVESLSRHHQEALQHYEQRWNELREMMTRYDGLLKQVAKRISDRDNARVDFDRARVKWERSNGDAVCEATARASEQQYVERNAVVVEQLDWFLQMHLQHMSTLLMTLAAATRSFYSWGTQALPEAPEVPAAPPYELPTPQVHHTPYTSVIVASTSPRPASGGNMGPPGRPERSGSVSAPAAKTHSNNNISNIQSPPGARLERSSGAPVANNNNNNNLNNNAALRPSPFAVKSPAVT